MADSAKAARGTDARRSLADDPVLQAGQMQVNVGQPQLHGTSSPSPTENPGHTRLRIRNGWTSAARKPDLNRSLTTKPECEPSHSQY